MDERTPGRRQQQGTGLQDRTTAQTTCRDAWLCLPCSLHTPGKNGPMVGASGLSEGTANPATQASAERDLEELRERAEKDGVTDHATWDLAFYSEAGKKKSDSIWTQSESDLISHLKPYFRELLRWPTDSMAFNSKRMRRFQYTIKTWMFMRYWMTLAATCRFFTPISILERGKELVRG